MPHWRRWPGFSKTIHYEITGAGRVDYQHADSTTEGAKGDARAVVTAAESKHGLGSAGGLSRRHCLSLYVRSMTVAMSGPFQWGRTQCIRWSAAP